MTLNFSFDNLHLLMTYQISSLIIILLLQYNQVIEIINFSELYKLPYMNKQQDAQKPQNKQNKERLKIAFKQKFSSFIHSRNYLVFSGKNLILAYNTLTRQEFKINISEKDFIVINFPPYIFACMVGQFIIFYPEKALLYEGQIQKCKISKMNVKCLCHHNKGMLLGGYNRSPFPGGHFTNKRSIYYMQNLDRENKNKPIWEINLPKSEEPISVLQHQNPYLLCYVNPMLYIINSDNKNILVSVEKGSITSLLMLEGRFSYNDVNILGIFYTQQQKPVYTLFTADMQKTPIYGIQITESSDHATIFCQTKDGRVFIGAYNQIFEYHPSKRLKKIFRTYQQNFNIMHLLCTHKNSLIALIEKSTYIQKNSLETDQALKSKSKKQSIIQVFHLD